MARLSGWDAIVVGGGASGLMAAATLAKSGARTLLLEARNTFGGTSENGGDGASLAGADPLFALDAKMVSELKLGLKFATRDLPLVALRPEGRHLVLGRDVYRTARAIAAVSPADAAAWPRFRREAFALARAMRALWWPLSTAHVPLRERDTLAAMKFSGAAAWLGRWFESDALKAALAFDATADAAAVNAPPSALILLWRLAQEMSGLQAAQALMEGGGGMLIGASLAAAQTAGVDLRSNARVAQILVTGGRVGGVMLASGERLEAPLVLSSLPRRTTAHLSSPGAFGLSGCDTLAPESATGMARILLSFDRAPRFGDGVPTQARFVIADRVESLVNARDAALAGQLPDELVFDAVPVPPRAPSAKFALSLRIRPVPFKPAGGWDASRALLAARAIAALGVFDRSLKSAVVGLRIATPEDVAREYGPGGSAASLARVFASAGARIATPVENLLLCGSDAEPVSAIAGRAARLAARQGLAMATVLKAPKR